VRLAGGAPSIKFRAGDAEAGKQAVDLPRTATENAGKTPPTVDGIL